MSTAEKASSLAPSNSSDEESRLAANEAEKQASAATQAAKLDSHVMGPSKSDEPDDRDIYAHLPAHEAEILRRQVEVPETHTSWLTLYRFSSTHDNLVMIASCIAAIAAGAAMPLM